MQITLHRRCLLYIAYCVTSWIVYLICDLQHNFKVPLLSHQALQRNFLIGHKHNSTSLLCFSAIQQVVLEESLSNLKDLTVLKITASNGFVDRPPLHLSCLMVQFKTNQ